MTNISPTSMLISSHLALVRQVLQEPVDNHKPATANQQQSSPGSNDYHDVSASLSSRASQSNSGTGNSHDYQKDRLNLSAVSRSGSQKLLEAMIDAMAGETEFDRAGSIINTYI